jgi:hypothetical protein
VLHARLMSVDPLQVVCYCSVGYRSSRLAVKLNKLGISNAVNLKGSIFKWCNEGRELVDGRGSKMQAAKAHPYNTVFGKVCSASQLGRMVQA